MVDSVFDAERLLNNALMSQLRVLKQLDARVQWRPIYEKPVSFDTERGELMKGGVNTPPRTPPRQQRPREPPALPNRDAPRNQREPVEPVNANYQARMLPFNPGNLRIEIPPPPSPASTLTVPSGVSSPRYIAMPRRRTREPANRPAGTTTTITRIQTSRSASPISVRTRSPTPPPPKRRKTGGAKASPMAKPQQRGKGATVKMDKKDYMKEHSHLISMLNDISAKAKAEATKQTKEVKGKGKKCVKNIKGGCGECGGTDGTIVKGGADRTPPRRRSRSRSRDRQPPRLPPREERLDRQRNLAAQRRQEQEEEQYRRMQPHIRNRIRLLLNAEPEIPEDLIYYGILPSLYNAALLRRYYTENNIPQRAAVAVPAPVRARVRLLFEDEDE
jgi:hypothetical protein